MQILEYDGSELKVQDTLTLEAGDTVRDVVFDPGSGTMSILTNVSLDCLFEADGQSKVISRTSKRVSSGKDDIV